MKIIFEYIFVYAILLISSIILGGNDMSFLDKIRGVVGESTDTQGDEYSSHVVLMEVEVYEEIGKVATLLMEEKSIIINVKTLNDDNVKRVVSFLEGALFVVGGEMKQLDDKTFLCVPNSVAIVDKEAEVDTEESSIEESDDLLEEEMEESEEQQKQTEND